MGQAQAKKKIIIIINHETACENTKHSRAW